jgi:hypothetical protein
MIREAYRRYFSLREEKFWIDNELALLGDRKRTTLEMVSPFPKEVEQYPSSDFLIDVVVANFKLNELYYRRYLSSTNAKCLSCDHTFKSAMNIGYFRSCDSKWITQYRAIFCILNELGQIMQWQLTSSECFEEVRGMFTDLKERFNRLGTVIEGVFIDNCCKWRTMINSVFPEVPVKLDIFHAVQRIVKKIPKKKKLSKELANDIGLVFRKTNDLGLSRMYSTPEPYVILDNLKKLETKWQHPTYKNGKKILSKDIKGEIKKLKIHVKKGCLSNIPPGCGTSRNERLHKDMNKILSSSRLGVDLAYTRTFRMFYAHNKKKDVLGKTVYDTRADMAKQQFISMIEQRQRDDCTEASDPNDYVETFGIRSKAQQHPDGGDSKDKKERKTLALNNFDYNTIIDTHASLQLLIQNIETVNDDSSDEENISNDILLYKLIGQALAWWAIALTFESLLGKRVVDRRKVPSIARAKLNTSTLGTKSNCCDDRPTGEEYAQRLHQIASSWGFSIVEIPKNGDCLFTAVALHLQQVTTKAITHHLENLGISSKESVQELATILRNLVVNEFVGPFREDYMDFIHGDPRTKYIEEAEKYRRCGTFAGQLGDAMPLALANVLGMPLMVLSLNHSTPFLDVCPREVKCAEVLPIYLAHYSTGGGHYDALINQNALPRTSTVNEGEKKSGKHIDEAILSKPFRACRCGVNKKSDKSNRKYSFRCPCIKSSGSCRPSCKCSGSCGDTKCRKLIEKSEGAKATRKSRKRGIQQLQYNSPKKSKVMKNRKELVAKGGMNIVEFYLLYAVISKLQSMGQSTLDAVFLFYTDTCKKIEETDFLSALPIQIWDKGTVHKEVRKILQDNENLDSFSNNSNNE